MAQFNTFTFLKRMNLGGSPVQQLNPAVMEITCLPDRPCSVALGMVKIALNLKGLKWLVYSRAWSYTNTRQVLFPADFLWRGFGHWMIPNLCFCHHGNLCKSQGSVCQVASKVQPQGRWGLERSFWHFYLATCTVRQRTSYFQHFYSCNSEAVDSFVQGKTGASICSEGLQGAEPSCVCPARTVFTLITTE